MSKKTQEQKASSALRRGGLGLLAAFVGLALLAANEFFNAEAAGVVYYLIILGVAFAIPAVAVFVSLQNEPRARRK